jgi:hypothetical protein
LVVWGNNIGVAYTTESVIAADNLPQSASFTKDGDEAEIRDAEGEVQTFVTYNKRETLDIEVIPIGTTLQSLKPITFAQQKASLLQSRIYVGSASLRAGEHVLGFA